MDSIEDKVVTGRTDAPGYHRQEVVAVVAVEAPAIWGPPGLLRDQLSAAVVVAMDLVPSTKTVMVRPASPADGRQSGGPTIVFVVVGLNEELGRPQLTIPRAASMVVRQTDSVDLEAYQCQVETGG